MREQEKAFKIDKETDVKFIKKVKPQNEPQIATISSEAQSAQIVARPVNTGVRCIPSDGGR